MEKILRYPAQKQPQSPPVAEVHQRHRRHAFEQAPPGDVDGNRRGRRQGREFERSDARMILRKLGKCKHPDCQPRKTHGRTCIKRRAPAIHGHDEHDGCGRRRVSDPRARVSDALSIASFCLWHPARHRGGGGRKGGPFAQPEQNPGGQHGRESTGHAGQDSGASPNEPTRDERSAGAKVVADPSPDYLKYEIGVGESGKNQADFSLIETEVF
jgi:hypothetical protein